MGVHNGAIIPQNGLQLLLDAANTKSYPGSGTTWTDLSGNGNTGTLTNSPTFTTDNGGAIRFDGTNDKVVVSDTADLRVSSSGITFGLWLRKDSGTGYDYYMKKTSEYMLRTSGEATSDLEAFVYIDTNSSGAVNAEPRRQTSVALALDTWTLAITTWHSDTSAYRLYVDGVSTGQSTKTGDIITTTNDVWIGGSAAGYPDCDIAYAFFYNRNLSDAEILDIYNATRGRFI